MKQCQDLRRLSDRHQSMNIKSWKKCESLAWNLPLLKQLCCRLSMQRRRPAHSSASVRLTNQLHLHRSCITTAQERGLYKCYGLAGFGRAANWPVNLDQRCHVGTDLWSFRLGLPMLAYPWAPHPKSSLEALTGFATTITPPTIQERRCSSAHLVCVSCQGVQRYGCSDVPLFDGLII